MSWFSQRKSTNSRKGSSRSRILKRRGTSAERILIWGKRSGLIIGASVLVGWFGAWFFMSGASARMGDWAHNKMLTASASQGFEVENILVEGRYYTDADAILAIVNLKKHDPIFLLDPQAAQDMIEKLSWVKTARVERRLPDTVYIEIKERTPMALWQRQQRLSLIDTEGKILTDNNLEPFKNYILLVGDDVPEHAPQFLKLLTSEPEIVNKVEAAKSISGRRWDLTLKNGAVVKLPEDNVEIALRRLAQMQAEENIMDKNINVIDVRESTRITIRTKPGAVREYKATYNPDQGNTI